MSKEEQSKCQSQNEDSIRGGAVIDHDGVSSVRGEFLPKDMPHFQIDDYPA
jgi:hypothetical protein